ncbi:unnamed protein product [Caenorhabditis bovis]|uniref:Uncharacterized protein n=1 Tax=Caenorhabditis bovis TaxID=2654633 RepID=A0A8S1ECQ7_9PELO|nr:unnamed protein product [Caenorhabditis bovis]
MNCVFLKILLALLIIVYIILYYEQIIRYAEIVTYGKPEEWLNVSAEECSCDGGTTRNCYPHPDDSALCGKCFARCVSQNIIEKERKHSRQDEVVIALTATMRDMNKLLVLIGSVHKHYPKTKMLIFNPDNSDFMSNQLISIRNVEVVRMAASNLTKFATPFYIEEALNRFTTVLWIDVGLEFRNNKLILTRKLGKSPVTFIGRDPVKKLSSAGYIKFFPTSSYVPQVYPLTILLKNSAKALIEWLKRCALDPECWQCYSSANLEADCSVFLLHRLAVEKKALVRMDNVGDALEKHSWSPPECDIYCTMYMIFITVAVVVFMGILVLVLLNRATSKKKS